jgi:hypothetical protein
VCRGVTSWRGRCRISERRTVAAPTCVGFDVGIFDPDLDPDGVYAAELTDTLVASLD